MSYSLLAFGVDVNMKVLNSVPAHLDGLIVNLVSHFSFLVLVMVIPLYFCSFLNQL